jgi:hypothetical protein
MRPYALPLMCLALLSFASASAAPVPKPSGPTPDQVKAAAEAFAELGGWADTEAYPLTGRQVHVFVPPSATADADLRCLPAVAFPHTLDLVLASVRVTSCKSGHLKRDSGIQHTVVHHDTRKKREKLANPRSHGGAF